MKALPILTLFAASLAVAAPVDPCKLLKPAEVAAALGVAAVTVKPLTSPALSSCEFRTHSEAAGNLSVGLFPPGRFAPGKPLAEQFRASSYEGLNPTITPLRGLGDDAVLITTLQERRSLSTTVRNYSISLLVRQGGVVLHVGGAQVTAGVSLGSPSPGAAALKGLARLALKRLP